MDIQAAAKRYMKAVESLHTIHGSTDVHDVGGMAGQAITAHCAYICTATGDRFDPETKTVVKGEAPHKAVLEEYEVAKSALEEALLSS